MANEKPEQNIIVEPFDSLIPPSAADGTANAEIPADVLLAAKFRELNHKLNQEESGGAWDGWDGWDGWAANAKELFRVTHEALKLKDAKTRAAVLNALAARFRTPEAFQVYALAVSILGAGLTSGDLAEICGLDRNAGAPLFGVWLGGAIVDPKLKATSD